MAAADDSVPDCEVLDGAACYPDGASLGMQNQFQRWFHAHDGQAVVGELARRHQVNWSLDEEPDIPMALRAQHRSAHLPTGQAPSCP